VPREWFNACPTIGEERGRTRRRWSSGARPRRVGSLIEGPGPVPRLTGREPLVLIARWAQAVDAEVDRVVGLLGLGRMTDRPTATYSSGMRQVLATAAALAGCLARYARRQVRD
jgi:ABC-type multidrug transport system ATPase subunit